MLKLNQVQAEVIYNSLLHTLRACNVKFDEKYELLQNEISDRHDVTDILDQLDHFYKFIASENNIEVNMLDKLHAKIENSLDSKISESVIIRIIGECLDRTQMLGMSFNELLQDTVTISLNDETGEIDFRQNVLFGIFWSFDFNTGELVGT